jgi:hypothetical protein
MAACKCAGSEKRYWRDDIRQAVADLGGAARLGQIYLRVREIRSAGGRSVPTSTDAIVFKELQHNSSSSKAFSGKRDWFVRIGGIGSGMWGLRSALASGPLETGERATLTSR